MEKLKMHTPDFTNENIAKIAELFPNCVTESRVENGKLKQGDYFGFFFRFSHHRARRDAA